MFRTLLKTSLFISATAVSLSTSLFGFGNFSECCNNGPLNCGALSVALKGGVTPTSFSGRGDTYLFRPGLIPPVINIGRAPKFSDQFQTPWQIGVELGWNASTNVQLFLEYVYKQASPKTDDLNVVGIDLARRYNDWKTNSLYLGTRYYFPSMFEIGCMGSLAPFFGFKGGFVWHERVRYNLRLADVTVARRNYYDSESALSAGLQLGVEWFYNCHLSAALTAEFVGTQPLRANRNVFVGDVPALAELGVTNISFGHTGKLVSYPITLAIRYTF